MFSKMDFRSTGVYVLFPKPMYRSILELIDTMAHSQLIRATA